MTTQPQPEQRRKGLTILMVFVGFLGLSVLYDEFRPKGGPSPDLDARLRCIARTVAMGGVLYPENGETTAYDPAFLNDYQSFSNEIWHYVRGLQTSDDPRRLFYRPIMIEEEAARDIAVAADPDGYVTTTWAEVQACADALGLRSNTA